LKFEYNAGYEEHLSVVFHPHFLKEYNSRWFLFGRMDKGDGTILEVGNCALDRIVGDIAIVDDISYIAAPNEHYLHYFDDIIGVTYVSDAPVEKVIFAGSPKEIQFILTKPLHWSQRCPSQDEQEHLHSQYPNVPEDWVFLTIECKWNFELITTLF
jgi:hypothetical protein